MTSKNKILQRFPGPLGLGVGANLIETPAPVIPGASRLRITLPRGSGQVGMQLTIRQAEELAEALRRAVEAAKEMEGEAGKDMGREAPFP